MKILRMTEIDTTAFKVGDKINAGKYTATCQVVTSTEAVFLLDQYLNEALPMNEEHTNKGGYAESDLRKELNSEKYTKILEALYGEDLVPFDNSDLLRVPYYGEIFGHDEFYKNHVEPDNYEQWELMKDRKNRIAFRKNMWEWGWLANTIKNSASIFAHCNDNGGANANYASSVGGVRPVFKIKLS